MNATDRPRHVDRAYRALTHPLRRAVLSLLHGSADPKTTLDALSERIATQFEDASEARIRSALHHVHLPKLRELGLVEYDERSGEVRYLRPRPAIDVLDAGLGACPAPD